MQITFTAYLCAAPQGSKRHVGNGRMKEMSKKLPIYRHDLALLATREMADRNMDPMEGPIGITLDFYFLKPKSAKKRKFPTVPPDLDKLQRATFDSMTGVVYGDDKQICEVNARKHYSETERVEISCFTL
jgi:crossover junction endodeoxyribonuclease RusA